MKTFWSVEADGTIILRTSQNAPLGIVGPIVPTTDMYEKGERGFTAVILQPGYPAAGPYQQRRQAAEWLQAWVKREWFPDAEFTDIPALGPREIARSKVVA